TLGLSLTRGTYCRLVSTVTLAPGHLLRIARRSGVASRMSPIELKRTTRMSGEIKVLCGTAMNVCGDLGTGKQMERPSAPPSPPSRLYLGMPRPKSILWVDDEVESLTSHILFLEVQGFAVETSTHGDDALVLLQRQPYGIVLLDEQMPGRRGLDLFQAIRAIDNGMPVVMVTKSEEPETLKDAIGGELCDYLIKPVNPRQILSVVTRLLEGDRIRQQRLSRDFATRFRELEARRGSPLAWREWVELVVELAGGGGGAGAGARAG